MKPWKISDIKLVSANLHFTDEQIGRLIGRTASMVKGFRKRNNILKHTNGFKKGNIPWNKGTSYQAGGRSLEFRFKKGEMELLNYLLKLLKIGNINTPGINTKKQIIANYLLTM